MQLLHVDGGGVEWMVTESGGSRFSGATAMLGKKNIMAGEMFCLARLPCSGGRGGSWRGPSGPCPGARRTAGAGKGQDRRVKGEP